MINRINVFLRMRCFTLKCVESHYNGKKCAPHFDWKINTPNTKLHTYMRSRVTETTECICTVCMCVNVWEYIVWCAHLPLCYELSVSLFCIFCLKSYKINSIAFKAAEKNFFFANIVPPIRCVSLSICVYQSLSAPFLRCKA